MNKSDKKYFSREITDRFLEVMDQLMASSRKDEKLTLASFGEIVGMAPGNIARLRSTAKNFVTVEAIARMCKHFSVSASYIITGEGERFQKIQESSDSRLEKIEKAIISIDNYLRKGSNKK